MEQARIFLTQFSGPIGYLYFFLLVTACGCGFPFNSDLTMIAAALLCAAGLFDIKVMIVLAFLAIMTGDSICFFVARKWGHHLLKRRPFLWILKEEKLIEAENTLNRHGKKFLFLVRFLPLIRTPLFFAAGTLKVAPASFYLMNATASLIYVPVLMLSGYYAGANIDVVLETLKRFQFGLLGACLLIAVALLVRKQKRKA